MWPVKAGGTVRGSDGLITTNAGHSCVTADGTTPPELMGKTDSSLLISYVDEAFVRVP
jgi:hypothetical protein